MRHINGKHEARAGHGLDPAPALAIRKAFVEQRHARFLRAIEDPIKGTRRGDPAHREKMLDKFESRIIKEKRL